MATHKNITHELGPPTSNSYTVAIVDTDARGNITAPAAMNGTSFGLQVNMIAAEASMNLRETFSAIATTSMRLRCYFDPNSTVVPSSSSQTIEVRVVNNAPLRRLAALFFSINSSGVAYRVVGQLEDDSATFQSTAEYTLSDAVHCVECAVTKETSGGANDGTLILYIDGVAQETLSGLSNTNFSTANEIGVFASATGAGSSGSVFVDEILVDDVSTTNLCAAVLTLPSMTKLADIDAAGTNIYIGLLDSGNPILIKFPTALDSDGTTVFDPGSGTDIGVQCGRFDADTIWIAGAFDGTNTVEKSEDAGTSFDVKDPGTFGAVSTFTVGPDTDDRVLIVDDGVDIQETTNDGGEWIAKNTGLTPITKSLARLDINVEEVAFGNESGASDNVDYSVNVGADLEDLSLPVMADVNDIIVN